MLDAIVDLDGFVDEPDIRLRFTERRIIPWNEPPEAEPEDAENPALSLD